MNSRTQPAWYAVPDPKRLDQWVRQVQTGDERAFDELILSVEREVRIFLSARADSPDMVDETLQNALVTCFENIHRYELRGTFLSWLKGIARNHLARALRERARFLDVEPDALERIVVEHRLEAMANEPDEETLATEAAMIERMKRCLKRLPPRAQKLLAQRYRDRTPIKRLAQNFKQGADALTGKLKRMRQALRVCIESAEIQP